MSLSRFFLYFSVLVIITGCSACLLEISDPYTVVLIPKFWLVFGFLSATTIIAFTVSYLSMKKDKERSVFGLIGGVVLKLLFCLVFVLIYLIKIKVGNVIFITNFFSLYFLFSAFEMFALLTNLRHQNKS